MSLLAGTSRWSATRRDTRGAHRKDGVDSSSPLEVWRDSLWFLGLRDRRSSGDGRDARCGNETETGEPSRSATNAPMCTSPLSSVGGTWHGVARRRGSSERTLAQPNAASFARRLVLPCRAGTTPGPIDMRSGRLAPLLTSRSTLGLPVRLTGYWSSLRLVTGAWRSRLLRQRAGVWSGLILRRRCSRRLDCARLRRESSSTCAKVTYESLKSTNRRP